MDSRTNNSLTNDIKSPVSLFYLFYTFLKIGSTSFGGYVALISVVQDQMVSKDKSIKNEEILQGMSLASVLPGPLAVNVVTFLGYKMRGFSGALISMIAVLLPSFVLIYFLSVAYFNYQNLSIVDKLFAGIIPTICMIILSVGIKMGKASIKDLTQIIICIISGLGMILMKSFLATLFIISASGLLGYIIYFKKSEPSFDNSTSNLFHANINLKKILVYGLAVIILLLAVFFLFQLFGLNISPRLQILSQIAGTFGGMSLTLFGGGYVFIPVIQDIVVANLEWLTVKEFVDGIALGQVTPGPILISAAFIGYKVAGLLGALVGTIAIFLPSALLMIFFSRFLIAFQDTSWLKAVFAGLRPAVIGMIFSAIYSIGKEMDLNWQTAVIIVISGILLFKFKVQATYLIPLSIILGLLLYQ